MTDSGHYHNDASYDHPASLVFGGLLYDKTMTPIVRLVLNASRSS